MVWFENLNGWQVPTAEAMLALCGCYFTGCATAGYYLMRARTGLDIRLLGSGSVGARNVGRFLGIWGFLCTLTLDFSKGLAAVWAIHQISGDARLEAMAMVAVVLGHVWPVQLDYHGGKGIATSLGAMLGYDWRLAMLFGGLYLLLWAMARRMTVAGLLAYTVLPATLFLMGDSHWKVGALATLAGIILLAHRRNLVEELGEILHRRSESPESRSQKHIA